MTTTSSSASATAGTPAAPGTASSTSADDCEVCRQRLLKTLADLDAKDVVIGAKDAQLALKDTIIKDQDERFTKMLKILQDFASVEKAERKSFWRSVGKYLKEVLKAVTDPAMIRTILEVIAVTRALEH